MELTLGADVQNLISLNGLLARNAQNSGRSPSPETREDWIDEYDRRDSRYLGEGYSDAEVRKSGLFLALDEDNAVIARTEQLTRDVQLVVDVGCSALTAGLSVLPGQVEEGDAENIQALGLSIWRRSRLTSRLPVVGSGMARLGRYGIEIQNRGGRSYLVPVDARNYRVLYDDAGIAPERVEISLPFFDGGEMDEDGVIESDGTQHSYIRILDRESVTTYVNGKIDKEQSGEHGLGVVPFVNLQFIPAGDSEHGLHAFHGLDPALRVYDSIFTQIRAAGNRFANPLLWFKGAKVGGNSKVTRFGRIVSNLPINAELGYLEPTLAGLKNLLESADRAREVARETLPEFIFAGAGPQASGEALKLRTAAFKAKYRNPRTVLLDGLARALDIAAHYDADTEYDEDVDRFSVVGDAILPTDTASELDNLETADRLGIKKSDRTRHLQRLGYADPDEEPEVYALAVEEERAGRAALFLDPAGTVDPDLGDDDEDEDVADDPTVTDDPDATDEPAQNTALNGAQIKSANDIVDRVARRFLPRESGVAMLVEFFNMDAARAERIMGEVGLTFFIEPEEDAAPGDDEDEGKGGEE